MIANGIKHNSPALQGVVHFLRATVFGLCLLLALGSQATLAADAIKSLVVVPESSGAAKKIYDQVIAGVQANPALQVDILNIDDGSSPDWLIGQIRKYEPELVIPIGNKSYKLCASIHNDPSVKTKTVAGGISGKPNGIPTLSLTASPVAAINYAREFAPWIKDLRLVYSEDLNGWWYEQAVAYAESVGIKVIGYKADDLQHGVKLYSKLMKEAGKNTSAVWIPLKSVVPSKTILPLVLEKAWSKNLPVISNNPSHTRLGGFMAFYPDHFAMGKQLAEFAAAQYRGDETRKIIGTDTLKIAVNVRTGSHLGLRFDNAQLERFDKVFPTMR